MACIATAFERHKIVKTRLETRDDAASFGVGDEVAG
jgi:hypothetical protein